MTSEKQVVKLASEMKSNKPFVEGLPAAVLIKLKGQVQGVGMRPWLFQLADSLKLFGSISNDAHGVVAHLEGDFTNLEILHTQLRAGAPPPILVHEVEFHFIKPVGKKSLNFDSVLTHSLATPTTAVWPAPPDLATCANCWKDFFNPESRYYRYPFVSCAVCGPRWSILRQLPFNREQTSYDHFPRCTTCESEYRDRSNRRFHAQTISCETCGPTVTMKKPEASENHHALNAAASALARGKIGAAKGLGGFQIFGSALDTQVIARMRMIKCRPHQSFALMFKDFSTFNRFGGSEKAWERLTASDAPIISTANLTVPNRDLIAPDLLEIGAMAPTTPFHYLLLEQCEVAIVTSANTNGFPIPGSLSELEHGFRKISELDFVIDHNREITNPVDDSVIRGHQVLRAARGLRPLQFPSRHIGSLNQPRILALGSDMKNSCAFANAGTVVELPYGGRIESIEIADVLRKRLAHALNIFSFTPEVVALDYHPQTLTERLFPIDELQKDRTLRVSHHEAHALSLRELKAFEPSTLLLSFDGTGFDLENPKLSAGGEGYFFEKGTLRHALCFSKAPLIGGDKAINEPWRYAVSSLAREGLSKEMILQSLGPTKPNEFQMELIDVIYDLSFKTNSTLEISMTNSAGRWFDAISAIVDFGLSEQTYEAQAPTRLETLASSFGPFEKPGFRACDYLRQTKSGMIEILSGRLTSFIASEKRKSLKGDQQPKLAALAHDCLAQVIALAASILGAKRVFASGGVFQNQVFSTRLQSHLSAHAIEFAPPTDLVNDQCLAYGQISWAHLHLVRDRLRPALGFLKNETEVDHA